jgi:virginiamycin B lyase
VLKAVMIDGREAMGAGARQLRRCVVAAICAMLALGWFPAGSAALATASAAESASTAVATTAVTPPPQGYPIALSTGSSGGVWYGGATEGFGRTEPVDRIDYITAAGVFLDFPFPAELDGFWPEAFAAGPNGDEWFLARGEGDPVPVLGEISPLGQITVRQLQVAPGSEVRGLAVGADGNLWMADTRIERLTRVSAILRVTPGGVVTAFSSGLQKAAVPDDITAGPDGALWFTDSAGRIGRVDTAGAIKEFPVGHLIDGPGPFGPPPPIVAGPDGALWFVLNSRQLGRMTTSGHIQIFTPPSSLQPPATRDFEEEALVGLAAGPDGDVWFTRKSGAVARIDARGRVRTVTNRLVAAKGIAFASDGTAWIGEEASFRRESDSPAVVPARLASVSTSGVLTQYPEPPPCRVPAVLGEGPSHAAEELRDANCELAGIRRPAGSHSNYLIVVAQSVHRGAVVGYKAPVRLVLGPRPPAARGCRVPRYVRVLARSSQLVAWMNPIREADNAASHGEGIQTYFACVPGHSAKSRFFTEELGLTYYDGLETLRTAGHFLAFMASSADHYNNGSRDLVVFDAARGERVFEKGYGFSSEDTDDFLVASFALNRRGEVAWVEQEVIWGEQEGHAVRTSQRDTLDVHDSRGTHAIEVGSNISDLSFHGDILDWSSSGALHTRTLR